MSLLKRSTPDELQAKQIAMNALTAGRASRQEAHDAEKAIRTAERAARAFAKSPAGQARTAFERGDRVHQYSLDVMSQEAIIFAMIGSATTKTTTDPSEVLNSVCREGWDLVNGSFVFVEQGQQSRDKFLASGQNVAIKGRTVGYYLFKRGTPAG